MDQEALENLIVDDLPDEHVEPKYFDFDYLNRGNTFLFNINNANLFYRQRHLFPIDDKQFVTTYLKPAQDYAAYDRNIAFTRAKDFPLLDTEPTVAGHRKTPRLGEHFEIDNLFVPLIAKSNEIIQLFMEVPSETSSMGSKIFANQQTRYNIMTSQMRLIMQSLQDIIALFFSYRDFTLRLWRAESEEARLQEQRNIVNVPPVSTALISQRISKLQSEISQLKNDRYNVERKVSKERAAYNKNFRSEIEMRKEVISTFNQYLGGIFMFPPENLNDPNQVIPYNEARYRRFTRQTPIIKFINSLLPAYSELRRRLVQYNLIHLINENLSQISIADGEQMVQARVLRDALLQDHWFR